MRSRRSFRHLWREPSRRLLSELVEDEWVDPARDHALLVVLDAGPVGECGVEGVRAVAESRETVTDFVGQVSLERQRGLGIGLAEIDVVQVEESGELSDGLRVIVDPQVDEDVTAAAVPAIRSDDEQRGALTAALVA